MTQEEISSGVRVLAYFAAFPAKVQSMLSEAVVQAVENLVAEGKVVEPLLSDSVVQAVDNEVTEGKVVESFLSEAAVKAIENDDFEFEFDDGRGFTGKEVEEKIRAIALIRMRDVFLSAIEDAKEMFGSADVSVVKELLEANPQLKDDADLGLRFVPLTFDQDRMVSWPMDKLIDAAKVHMRSRS
jgi:hypothetical protein